MEQAKLSQDESLSLKLAFLLSPKAQQRVDLYFSLPVEMGINPSTMNEEDYFHSNVKSHSAYYSKKLHLPLVRSRFISQNKGQQQDYRLNLNLYTYQIRIALDADIKHALTLKDADDFYATTSVLVEQSHTLLKKLRRYSPPDKKLYSFFENADNYLSWHIEQAFLKLLSKGVRSSEHASERQVLRDFCISEAEYRLEKKYNSQVTLDDPNRITNKMRLLQRLTEYGVVFKRDTRNLNQNLKRLVKGSVTAVIMAFVMLLVLNARSSFTEITAALVAVLGVIYGLREIFKDDVTRVIWRKIQKGRPKWRSIYSNSVTSKRIYNQTLWLEYIKQKDLPKDVHALYQKRRQQNKQAAQLLHFRCDSKVLVKQYLPGYDEIQQHFYFNLTPLVRFLKKGEGRLFTLEDKKVSSQAVERRYQINVIVKHTTGQQSQLQRYKITLNRSRIVNIEAIAPVKAL